MDFTRMIIEVAKMQGLSLAANNTKGFKPLVDSMETEVAFFGLFVIRVIKKDIVGAMRHTDLAPITFLFDQNHQPVFSFDQSI